MPVIAAPGDRPDWVVRTAVLATGAERREHYDFMRRLQLVQEPDGSWLRYRHDASGRLAAIEHSSGERVWFRRTEREMVATTDRSETRVTFDARGFPESLTVRIDERTWSVHYQRGQHGQVEAIRYPQGTDVLQVGHALRCGDTTYAEAALPRILFANGTSAIEEWTAGAPAQLARIAHVGADGAACVDDAYAHEPGGRLARAGNTPFGYDEAGRLVGAGDRRYVFDARGLLVDAAGDVFAYGTGPAVTAARGARFDYDALGRRTARSDAAGVTRYTYNLFGQCARVELPHGRAVDYIYDGFGRLVGRQGPGGLVYYVLDLDGRRLAECDAAGRITRSYLWLGPQCVGMVDGPCGGALSMSFHRVHGGTLVGIGDADGRIRPVAHADPYGGDAPIVDGIPGYAGLFGDSETGLLYASSRWLDPSIGQFTTPDSWHGTHALEHLAHGLRPVLDALPGGTGRLVDAASAYSFCAWDPVNYCDPTGHNVLGIIWSVISAFVWQMQITSVALQMEVVSLVLWILLAVPVFMFIWDFDGWMKLGPLNAIPPLLTELRLNVPFAFPLNSIWNSGGAVFTMGSVIWVRGDQLETLEKTAKRDLLLCSNADSYQSAAEVVAADAFRVRSPHARGTGTANAAGTQLTGVAITTPPGAAVADTLAVADWLSIRLTTGGGDELRKITNVLGATVSVDQPLPAPFLGQAVEFARADLGVVRIDKDDTRIARTVVFVRGQALHFQKQLPENFPTEGLAVTEYMKSARRRATFATSTAEAILVRLKDAADQALFVANDFLRVRAGKSYFARAVARLRGARDLILDAALPAPAQPTDYGRIEVVKLDADAQAAGQAAIDTRVDAGTLTALRKQDGLAITNAAAPPATERRIVLKLFLRCPLTALPAALQGVSIAVDVMTPDGSVTADGTVGSATEVTTADDQAKKFGAHKPVRVHKDPAPDFFTTLSAVDRDANLLTLDEPLPAADFPAGTPVTVTLMAAARRFEAEAAPAPGDQVLVVVEQPDSPVVGDVIRVRPSGDKEGGVLRAVGAALTVVAEVDSAVPASHVANLTVQRFVPVADTLRDNAAAPLVQIRLTITAGANPYVQDDELHLLGDEEAYGRVLANPIGADIILVDPVEFSLGPNAITLEHITPTGHTTPDGRLDESLIMIPSDPGEPPITRRRAVEAHEMRHVWQYAVLGPFFFSLPLPWLINLGFSFTDSANEASKWTRWFSLGNLDFLFAMVAWGLGVGGGGSDLVGIEGEVTGAERKIITVSPNTHPDTLNELSAGLPCDVAKDDYETFNTVTDWERDTRTMTLQFALEGDRFAVGDQVRVSVSPFEKIRRVINKWFSLNFERIWSDHIPQAWGRALSRLLNRESWLPLLGFYPLAWFRAGFNQSRIHFEQDAGYHSGDLYTNLAVSQPNDIFVGQFTRLMGFLSGRGAGDTAVGLSDESVLFFLTVEVPAALGNPLAAVAGAVDASTVGANRVRFRENYYIPLEDRVENAIGVFFVTSRPFAQSDPRAAVPADDYVVHVTGELTEDVVRTVSFDADFLELRKLKVKPLVITPAISAAESIFETEQVVLNIQGDSTADYELRYAGAPPVPQLVLDRAPDGPRITAPVAGAALHRLQITATYGDDHPVFQGAGQKGAARLTAEQRTNLCQEIEVTVALIPDVDLGTVTAGSSTTFPVPIQPASVTVTSALPAGATVNASVVIGTGRPAEMTFIAPDAVTAATDVTFVMRFGTGAIVKPVNGRAQVTP
jgi:RHS repeat-associated protein